MKLQQMLSIVRKAVDEFQMIETGDRIAAGVSGGIPPDNKAFWTFSAMPALR